MNRSSWAFAVVVSAVIAAAFTYVTRDVTPVPAGNNARPVEEPATPATEPAVQVMATPVQPIAPVPPSALPFAPVSPSPFATPAETPAEPPLEAPPSPAERPARLQVRAITDTAAIDAQLPDLCPLTAVEYRLGSLATNVLVERFDDASTSRGAVVGRRRIQVNTDGAANSYHSRVIRADDATIGALNTVCNAQIRIFKKVGDTKLTVVCRQGTSVTDEYAAAYEELRNNNWEDTDSGYSIQFNWNILAHSARTRPIGRYMPCIKDDGFFVAKTRLRLGRAADECDASVYPDSGTTSTFVLPINWFAAYEKKSDANPARFSNFRSGDVVVAVRPGEPNRPPVWVYGVVGDAGPLDKLGEASIAFNRQLQQSRGEVKTYKAAMMLDTARLKPGEIGFVVFEGSASDLKRNYSAANIKAVGERRLAAWAGGALEKAQSRLLACTKKLELLPPPAALPPS